MTSVRKKLLVTLLLAVVVLSLASMAATYVVARHQLDIVFDYQLQQVAHLLSDRALAEEAARLAPPDSDISVQIAEGGIRMNLTPQTPAPELPDVSELGFSTLPRADGDWRVFAMQVGSGVVQVGQPLKVRETMAFHAAVWTLLPIAVLLPLLALLVWSIVGRGMSPFARLAGAVKLVRYGADCYAYGLLAAGFVDLVVEASLKPYDFCAMVPIVEGAGGVASDWQGAPLTLASDGRVVVAGDPSAHRAARALLVAGR